MIACTWDNPGADRFTGTVAAAIASYGLPATTQAALIGAFERREFDDVVVIDRDSIRGQHAEYAPQLERMHFGGNGRTCDTVTRAGWTAEHVETALVACAEGVCVAWPAVCGNVSIVTRIEPAPTYMDGSDLRTGGPIGYGYAVPIPLAAVPSISEGGDYASGSWGAATGYAVDSRPGVLCNVAAVPEEKAWVLIGMGLVAVWKVGRKT